MAFSVYSSIAKNRRAQAAAAKETQEPGRYLKTMFFNKGERRAVLAVWERRMEFEVYADPRYSQKVEWNDPDCKCLDHLGSPVNILRVLSALNDNGFVFTNEMEWDGPD